MAFRRELAKSECKGVYSFETGEEGKGGGLCV